MKKLILAVIILAIILSAGLAEQIYLNKIFDELDSKVENIISIAKSGESAYAQTEELSKWWGQKHKLPEALVNHNEINEITLLVAELQGYSKADMAPDFLACAVRLKETAIHIRHLLDYRPEHIF